LSWAWWYPRIIPAPETWGGGIQVAGYIESSRPAWATSQDSESKNKKLRPHMISDFQVPSNNTLESWENTPKWTVDYQWKLFLEPIKGHNK
jgi:hypothetical protein